MHDAQVHTILTVNARLWFLFLAIGMLTKTKWHAHADERYAEGAEWGRGGADHEYLVFLRDDLS